MIVTLTIYSIYWSYSTPKEVHIANGKDEGAGMWTTFLFLQILSLFAVHHSLDGTGSAISKLCQCLAYPH